MSKARREKWKRKDWYRIYAPPYFGEVEIGSTMSDDPSKLLGRTMETTLFDITQDPAHQYINIYFQVKKIDGERGLTIFKGHEYLRDYLKSLIRRRSSKVDRILNVTTKDGYRMRVSAVALTTGKIASSQKTAIRKVVERKLIEKAQSCTFEEFARELTLGTLNSEIFDEAKKVTTLRHFGIFKSKLLSIPSENPS